MQSLLPGGSQDGVELFWNIFVTYFIQNMCSQLGIFFANKISHPAKVKKKFQRIYHKAVQQNINNAIKKDR